METPNELAGWSTSPSATPAPSSLTLVPASAVSSETSMESQSYRTLPSIGGTKDSAWAHPFIRPDISATSAGKEKSSFCDFPPLHFGDNRSLSSPLRTDKGPRMELSLSPVLFSGHLPKPFL
ncbi:hypothetical protein DY000_02006233 [Brassica cretica]|uniref:Growth-regulating factor n=1 Tax=Brassica cretica TaxID=69181 RepID=A0ABQ7CC66_BRACR|nr:hypothetical protein DY000_02006233 [Brassica cretica]